MKGENFYQLARKLTKNEDGVEQWDSMDEQTRQEYLGIASWLMKKGLDPYDNFSENDA